MPARSLRSAGRGGPELIVFLGPSLPWREARRELARMRKSAPGAALRVSFEPPARQGDLWRALARRPRAIALIDGVFESSPSVWHHELLDALDAGVLLFGASSMGALRASELASHGMIGVGQIYARYRDGLDDDAAVALLHASAEHQFAPLTVALVNAEHAIAKARAAEVLSADQARRMSASAAALHYQERRWPEILEGARLSKVALARWSVFAAQGLPDLKADDARLCLRESARAALAQRSLPPRPASPRSPPGSALVRARRPAQLLHQRGSRPPDSVSLLHAQRTLLLAGLARLSGLSVSAEERAALAARLLGPLAPAQREALLVHAGAAEDELQRALETLALEEKALALAAQLLPDGPSPLESARLAQLLAALLRAGL